MRLGGIALTSSSDAGTSLDQLLIRNGDARDTRAGFLSHPDGACAPTAANLENVLAGLELGACDHGVELGIPARKEKRLGWRM